MPRTARVLGAALILASVGALAISIPAMARQIRASNASVDLPFFGTRSPAYEELPFIDGKAVFSWGVGRGQAPVAVTLDEANERILVDYRGETRAVPVTGMVDERLPGFARFRDGQIRLVAISEERPRRMSDESLTSEPVRTDRLVLAARVERDLREGEDPSEMAGMVDRKSWRYELLEFAPPGVDTDAPMISVQEIAYDDLPEWERTWQYAAALVVTPSLKFPKLKDPMASNRGLDGVTWPFPVAGSAILAGSLGLILFGGSFVKRPEDDGANPGATPGKSAPATRANA
jgi:hypothetical protein